MQAVQLITYVSILVGLIAMAAKAFRYATAPESMRWELYPVPHEKGRSEYGGSYLEELDWWTKARKTDLFNELKEMFQEIILLKGVYHHNRTVWTFSMPFHFGLYVAIGWLGFLILGAIMQVNGADVTAAAGGFGVIVYYLTIVTGYAGMILAAFGACGLFFWRMGNKFQRSYSSPIEYVNLVFFDIVIVVALINHFSSDFAFTALRDYVAAVITLSPTPAMSTLLTTEIILGSLLVMYIPLTRMSHFVAKYFLYHAVRWNDEPNERGSKIEKRIIAQLGQKVGWSAPHIQTGKTWGEVVKETNNEQR